MLLEAWTKGCGKGEVREADLWSLLELGAGRKRRPQQMVSYRVKYKTELLGLKGRRESEDLKIAYLLSWQTWQAGSQEVPAEG